MGTIKTAISLPQTLYLRAERLRKKLGKSRSQMMAEGLARMVKEAELLEKEDRDEAAYRRRPHTKEEIAAATAANERAWADLDQADKIVDWEGYFAPMGDLDRGRRA
jgi:metal-responsive CopG/Arc/MetJ family transcriptional regulator